MKTSRKKFKQKVKAMKIWLYENRDVKTKDLIITFSLTIRDLCGQRNL